MKRMISEFLEIKIAVCHSSNSNVDLNTNKKAPNEQQANI